MIRPQSFPSVGVVHDVCAKPFLFRFHLSFCAIAAHTRTYKIVFAYGRDGGAAGASCAFFSPTIMGTCSEWFIPFAVYVRYYHISRCTRTTGYTLCVCESVGWWRRDGGRTGGDRPFSPLAVRSRNSTGSCTRFLYSSSLLCSPPYSRLLWPLSCNWKATKFSHHRWFWLGVSAILSSVFEKRCSKQSKFVFTVVTFKATYFTIRGQRWTNERAIIEISCL